MRIIASVPVSSSSIINTGYAVLALVADALVVLTIIGLVASRLSPAGRAQWTRLRDGVTPFALHMAWIVAVLATFGSLFLQYEEGLNPCDFCWFQRICMYPLSLLLGIAAFRGDLQTAKRYFIALAVVGAGLATYHYQLELFPNQPLVCSQLVPCNARVINVFGFISVPFLSFAAFALITTLLLLARRRDDEWDDEEGIDQTDDVEAGDEPVPAPA